MIGGGFWAVAWAVAWAVVLAMFWTNVNGAEDLIDTVMAVVGGGVVTMIVVGPVIGAVTGSGAGLGARVAASSGAAAWVVALIPHSALQIVVRKKYEWVCS